MRKRAQSCYEPSLVNKFTESDDEEEEDSAVKLEDELDIDENVEVEFFDEFDGDSNENSNENGIESPKDEMIGVDEEDVEAGPAPYVLDRIIDTLLEMNKDVRCSFRHSLETLDYRKLQVDDLSPGDLKKMVEGAVKKVRKYRTLHEILLEVKENMKDVTKHPERPPKAMSSYNFFMKERWNGFIEKYKDNKRALTESAKAFKNLSSRDKRKYINLAEADQKRVAELLEQFKKNHPDLKKISRGYVKTMPQEKVDQMCHGCQAYLIERTKALGNSGRTFRTVRAEWNKLSLLEKARWVNKALKNFKLHQLTQEDLQIYFDGQGLPKRPSAAYPRFVHDMSGSIDATGPAKLKEISELWNKLPLEKKEKYYRVVRAETEEWHKKCERFLASLSMEETLVFKKYFGSRKVPGIPKIPTKAKSAYNCYIKEQYPKFKELGATEAMKKMSATWKSLGPEEKEKYIEMERQAKVEFEENLLNAGMPVKKSAETDKQMVDRLLIGRKKRRTKAEMAAAKEKLQERKKPKVEKVEDRPSPEIETHQSPKRETSVELFKSPSKKSKQKETETEKQPEEVKRRKVDDVPSFQSPNKAEKAKKRKNIEIELNTTFDSDSSSKTKRSKKDKTFDPLMTSTQATQNQEAVDDDVTAFVETVTQKKKKDKKKAKEPMMEPPKPPKSVFKLFMNTRYPGEKQKAKEKYKRLKESKKEKLQREFDLLHEDYKDQLKKYIQSLSPSDREAYKKKFMESQTTDTDA